MNEIIDKYQTEFKELVNIVERVHNDKETFGLEGHLKALYEELQEIREEYPDPFYLSKVDLKQELYAIWLKLIHRFSTKQPACHIKSYLLRCSVWELRDWYKSQAKIVTYTPILLEEDASETEYEFALNLSFLMYGTNYFPLCELSAYERYLIFLKFKEEKNILEIAYTVQKGRNCVARHLNEIYMKLRRLINENTRRFSERGTGGSTRRNDREGAAPRYEDSSQ
jgi:DNA-directed RNA polymerase specialized sigma24 family protein